MPVATRFSPARFELLFNRIAHAFLVRMIVVACGMLLAGGVMAREAEPRTGDNLVSEQHSLTNSDGPITLQLAVRKGAPSRYSVILMLGAIESNRPPDWST